MVTQERQGKIACLIILFFLFFMQMPFMCTEAHAATQDGRDYDPDQVLVCFKDSVGPEEVQEALDGVAKLPDDPSVLSTAEDTTGSDVVLAEVLPGVTVTRAVTELSQKPEIVFAQPNYIYTFEESNDPSSVRDTVKVNDPDASEQWYLDDVKAPEAWAEQKSSDSDVAVAVVDTGCDVNHPDLAGNIVATYNAVDSSSDVTDTVGHGTGVCGVIAAVAGNGTGIAGVSYNARLVPVKANTTSNTFTSASIVSAISYVLRVQDTYNIRVINMSLAAVASSATTQMERAIYAAIDEAYDAGILVVCAAGNASSTRAVPYAAIPGDYDKCLSVMNLTRGHVLSSSSNYNLAVDDAKDLCAPGSDIYTCGSEFANQQPYHMMSGTSFSAPMVSGVAALCYAANPQLGPARCAQILEDTATDLGTTGWDERYGYGEVDATAAVRRAKASAATIAVLRLYNPYSGEHLYTTNKDEYGNLAAAGWRGEGVAWYAAEQPGRSVYRLYNPYSGDHLYTQSFSEYAGLSALGWRQEGTAFYASDEDVGGVPVLRLFNPYVSVGTHLYTTNAGEYADLVGAGWRGEGTAFYGIE